MLGSFLRDLTKARGVADVNVSAAVAISGWQRFRAGVIIGLVIVTVLLSAGYVELLHRANHLAREIERVGTQSHQNGLLLEQARQQRAEILLLLKANAKLRSQH